MQEHFGTEASVQEHFGAEASVQEHFLAKSVVIFHSNNCFEWQESVAGKYTWLVIPFTRFAYQLDSI